MAKRKPIGRFSGLRAAPPSEAVLGASSASVALSVQPAFRYLTPGQLLAIVRGAQPIMYSDRPAYFAAVTELLALEKEVGDGTVHRIVVAAQRRFDLPQPADLPAPWSREW